MAADLVGRLREQRTLRKALEDVRSGRGQFVLVSAEAGMGKTTLLRWLHGELGTERVGWTTGLEGIASMPFGPWRQLLDQASVDASALRPSGGPDDRVATRAEQFDAVLRSLIGASRDGPVLLFVDDAQWLDPSSRVLLSFLAAHAIASRALIVAAVRVTVGDSESEAMVDELSRHGARLSLGGLDEHELAMLAASRGRPADESVTRSLLATSGGNPLFALELLSAGETADPLDSAGAGVAVPVRVRRMLLTRAEPLPSESRRVLVAAAVAGDAATIPLLARALSCSEIEIATALDDARRLGVLVDQTRPDSFVHPLMRAALIDDTSFARLVRLHQQVADALVALRAEGLPVAPSRVAAHLVAAASAGAASEAVSASIEAAAEATGVLAYEEAARWYGQAVSVLDLAPHSADRLELLMLYGEAEQAAGRREAAREHYLEAAQLASTQGDAVGLAGAALAVGSGGGFEINLFDDAQQGLLMQALEALGTTAGQEVLRARVLARLSVARAFAEPPERRERVAAGALAMARMTKDDSAVIDALAAWCDAIAGPDGIHGRLEASAEMLALAQQIGDAPGELLARRMRVMAFLELGDFSAVEDEIADYEFTALRVRQPMYSWYVPLWRATLAWASDEVSIAETLAVQAAETAGGGPNAGLLVGMSKSFGAVDGGIAVPAPTVMLDLMGGWDPLVDVWLSVASAFVAAANGDIETARTHLHDARPGLAGMAKDSEYLPALAQASAAAAKVGDVETATWLYSALLPYRDQFAVEGIGAYTHGSIERHLGLLAAALGRPDDARQHFEQALDRHWMLGVSRLVRLTKEAQAASGVVVSTADQPSSGRGTFRRDGDVWRVGLGAESASVRHSKGMADLARLIAEPGREFAALDLVQAFSSEAASGEHADLSREGDLGDLVDSAARVAYQARLADIEGELGEADASADSSASLRLSLERDALVEQLSQAYGLGGRARRAGDPAERARSTVTARIRDAVRKIEAVEPGLGRHLGKSVRTGRFCCYDPETPVAWET